MKKIPIPKGWRKVTKGLCIEGDRLWDGVSDPVRWINARSSYCDLTGVDVQLLYCCIRRKWDQKE